MAGRNGNKRIGRNREKCTKYKASGRREQQKVRNVYRSNGPDAAMAYAKDKGLVEYLAVMAQNYENMMVRLGKTRKS